jgi:hypothetical protein
MSTATERVMRERGDCRVFHEPFLVDYYLHRGLGNMPMLEADKTKPQDYVGVRSMLLDAAREQPVFFKDMSYYVVPRIFDDRAFAGRLRNVFLVRDPRFSIASYYKLDQDFSQIEVGIEAQWQHFCFLRDELGEAPVVLSAEAVADNPRGLIGAMWQYCGLPFVGAAFSWDEGEVPRGWEYVQGWHKAAVSSSEIHRETRDPDEVFEIAASRAPHLRDYLAYHWPAFENLMAEALQVDQA